MSASHNPTALTPLDLGAAQLTSIGESAKAAASGHRPPITVPSYERDSLRPSIVHLGVGGFHRAHLALYIDELCAMGTRDWSIVGGGILAHDSAIADALAAQDHLYSLIVRGPEAVSVRIIGSIVDYIHAHPDAKPLVDRIANPDTQIVSLTITESGYPVDDGTGLFNPDSPVSGPGSAFAILALALGKRRDSGSGPITVISCDNIVSNGRFAMAATIGEAQRLDPSLAEWIATEVAFPNSMVDRITPATTDADRQWLKDQTGIVDRWPVVTEPFTQWVLENSFAADRPPLEDLGVILTSDVEPYERMKLRLLNAGHSCLAYLSALAGFEFVHDAMAEASISRYVEAFLALEATPVLPPVANIDLDDYQTSLIERFSNPQIADQISRLCLHGSAKFPKFLMPTVRARLQTNRSVALSALAIAGWAHYLLGQADDGSKLEVSPDPLLTKAIGYATKSAKDPAHFLHFEEVFPADLAQDRRFIVAFTNSYNRLGQYGVVASINLLLGELGHR